jgi:hypothetical protein
MQCVGISPTISPGAPSAVVGRYAVLFFFDHRDTRVRFHFNSLATDPHVLARINKVHYVRAVSGFRVFESLTRLCLSVWVCGYFESQPSVLFEASFIP